MFLSHNIMVHFNLNNTEAVEMAAVMIDKSDRTVRQWQTDLVANNGILPETKQVKYQRTSMLWYNKTLATEYVRLDASVKGTPNMTAIDFCKWVDKSLLPNSTLEPGFPRNISAATARRWLHELGFQVIKTSKGIFIDSHERKDVIEERNNCLHRMVKIGFLHFTNAPTESSQKSITTDMGVNEDYNVR